MANFGPLTAEIRWRVWGTPANFNGLRVLASLLHRRRSPEANQTLRDVWSFPGLVRYIYICGGSYPLTEFCPVQNSLYVQVLRSILAALLHGIPAPAAAAAKLRRGRTNEITELSQRAPSIFGRATSAHISSVFLHSSCFSSPQILCGLCAIRIPFRYYSACVNKCERLL